MIDVGRRQLFADRIQRTVSGRQLRGRAEEDNAAGTRPTRQRCGTRAPSDVVSPQHDDRLIVERLSACSKGAERCRELTTECFG